jgi:hypothetical protein
MRCVQSGCWLPACSKMQRSCCLVGLIWCCRLCDASRARIVGCLYSCHVVRESGLMLYSYRSASVLGWLLFCAAGFINGALQQHTASGHRAGATMLLLDAVVCCATAMSSGNMLYAEWTLYAPADLASRYPSACPLSNLKVVLWLRTAGSSDCLGGHSVCFRVPASPCSATEGSSLSCWAAPASCFDSTQSR